MFLFIHCRFIVDDSALYLSDKIVDYININKGINNAYIYKLCYNDYFILEQ